MIFATRRGGSSLIMRLVYSQPNLDFIELPLDLINYNPYKSRIPSPEKNNRFIKLNEAEEEMLFKYFNDLFSGKIRLRNQYNILDRDFSFNVNRIVIKEVLAKSLVDWFTKNFNIDVIYFLRHPIPTAISAIKFGFDNLSDGFLNNEYFRNQFLDSEKVNFAFDVLKNNSDLEKHVMDWCLDNLYPLKCYKDRDWLTLSYEELLLRPMKISNLICSRMKLPDPLSMYQRIFSTTKTNITKKTKKIISAKNSNYQINRWLKYVSSKELDKINEMLDVFNIDVYSADSPYPRTDLCHFGSLRL